jgi:hypothetical protein
MSRDIGAGEKIRTSTNPTTATVNNFTFEANSFISREEYMSTETTRNQIKHERLIAGRRKSERKRRKPTSDELWEEYFRLSNLAHVAFEAAQACDMKKRAETVATQEAEFVNDVATQCPHANDSGESPCD